MKRLLTTSALNLIVTVGLVAAGHAMAQEQNDNSGISQAICEARLSHSKRPEPEADNFEDNTSDNDTAENISTELSVDGWSDEALDLLNVLNKRDFDEGTLSIIDCVGSSNTARVRTQSFTLEQINRKANEQRGWVINSEATNLDEPTLRFVQLELPPIHLWKQSTAGNGFIATDTIFYARGDNDSGRFPRNRTTEVTPIGGGLQVTQRFTTNDLFDELLTWTLE